MCRSNIPFYFLRFFQWFCRQELFEELQGDLEEAFEENKVKFSPAKARAIYRLEILKMIRPSVVRFGGQNSKFNQTIMLRNYYITAIRNLTKHKSYFLINISGLAIGIACFTFISLYIINELSYDRFHTQHENIFRVSNHAIIRGEPNNDATTSAPMAKAMLENYPEVVAVTRIADEGSKLVGQGNDKINEEQILYADATLFDVFSFELLKGNPKTALEHPRSMVLTESYVDKYFDGQDPMGKWITIEEDTIFYTITGIVKDVPANSHIQFGMLASLSSTWQDETDRWVGSNVHCYAQLSEGTVIIELQEKIHELFYQFMAKEIEFYTGLSAAEWEGAGNEVTFKLEPLADIHLNSISKGELEPSGNITYIYGLIGVIILFIAVFNFVNLATAHSATRAKEVGVRKVIGSTKYSLVVQFMVESVVVSVIATMIGALIVMLLTPSFIELIDKQLAYRITSSYLGPLTMAG